jgi:hypothetical protein
MKTVYFKIFVYFVYIPLSIIGLYFAMPPAYTHYRAVFLAQMNRVYEKDRSKKMALQMADLSDLALPPMPEGGL